MKHGLSKIVAILLLFQTTSAFAQERPPFWDEIQQFKKTDSVHPLSKGAILLVGSSSFRMWTDAQEYFPSHTIINRGFGGSTLLDMIRYEEETIFNYKPKQVVIYGGDNDLAASDTVTAGMVYNRFIKLFTDIRTRLTRASVVYVSIKPSPSRWRLRDKMTEANTLIKNFLAKKKNTAFADVWTAMLDGEGKPIDALFKDDKLHMKPAGYAIWQKAIEPCLLK